MKVCTDACIFGAWYASRITNTSHILDIGSGTGLLMMMLAQKTAAEIHGIEIEPGCYQQLVENTSGHEWSTRMRTFHGDARAFSFPVKYDFIISNPPFYDNDLSSDHKGRQLAMHSSALKLDELVGIIGNNLSSDGRAGILLPAHRSDAFDKAAERSGLMAVERLLVRHTAKHPWFRIITTYVHTSTDSRDSINENIAIDELTIRDAGGVYTVEFLSLLNDYYL